MSSEISGEAADLSAITDASAAAASGVPAAEQLIAFAEAVLRQDSDDVETARATLLEAVGPDATVDAAAVVGNFQRMVRIADATGIPLDAPVNLISVGIRNDLGLDDYGSAANTRRPGAVGRLAGRMLMPLFGPIMRLLGRSYRT